MNNTSETVTFDKNNMIGILDLRSLGYYKVKQDYITERFGKTLYILILAEDVCAQFNRFVNLLKTRGRDPPKEKIPLLAR